VSTTVATRSPHHRTGFATPLLVFPHCIFSQADKMWFIVSSRKFANDKQRKSNLLLVFTHHQPSRMARNQNRARTPERLQ
jgi:hypothetical protein